MVDSVAGCLTLYKLYLLYLMFNRDGVGIECTLDEVQKIINEL